MPPGAQIGGAAMGNNPQWHAGINAGADDRSGSQLRPTGKIIAFPFQVVGRGNHAQRQAPARTYTRTAAAVPRDTR
jgi:hypothetical protein